MRFRAFRNKLTGQIVTGPTGRYQSFMTGIKKIVNYVKYNFNKRYVALLTLTVADNVNEVDGSNINRVMTMIRVSMMRVGSQFKYVWVKEFQHRGAIHYHVLLFYDVAYAVPSVDRISESWGLGFVNVRAPKIKSNQRGVAGYMAKYIGKGYEYEALSVRRSWSAAVVESIYKLQTSRMVQAVERFGAKVAHGLYYTWTRAYVVGTCVESGKTVRQLVMRFASDWEYWGLVESPF